MVKRIRTDIEVIGTTIIRALLLAKQVLQSRVGRFVNADALIGSSGDLLGYNIFIYCPNNSVNIYDPTGIGGVAPFQRSFKATEYLN